MLAIAGSSFTAFYDACVLHPFHLRYVLVALGGKGVFRARWSAEVLDEMVRSILRRRPDLTAEKFARTVALMNRFLPEAQVTGYEALIPTIELPDPDDRHVVAAARHAGAQVIVTHNLKDFPAETLKPLGLEAQSPDTFVSHLIELDAEVVADTISAIHGELKAPPLTLEEFGAALARDGLEQSIAELGLADLHPGRKCEQ
ncbi:MAG: PIN domain-containing protein [Planctomycetota bacterium]